jgi:CRISPR-associated exonuclease Cas4
MTTSALLLLILLAIAALIIGWKIARRWQARASEEEWRPQELQYARLAFAEKTFKTWRPIRLIARADRGYRLNGKLHLAEFKTRARAVAYSSDVIELSAQRLAIETSTGELMSDIGYVLVQNSFDKRRSVHQVRLLPRADVIAVAKRREAILKGRVAPRYSSSQGLCRHCTYRAECKAERPDQG